MRLNAEFRQTHELPHQIERQIGTARRHPIDDHRPLQVEVLEGLSPIDERSSIPYRDQPLGDLGRDVLAAGLAGEFEPQPTPDVRVVLGESHEDADQAVGAQSGQVFDSNRLLRRHDRHRSHKPSKRLAATRV